MRHGHLHLTRSILLLSVCVSFAGSLGPVAANGGSTPGAQSSATSKVYLPLVALTHPTLNATIATSIWTHLLGSTWAVGWDVAVDGNQNVYVVGHNYGDLDGRLNFGDSGFAFVSMYSSDGVQRWMRLAASGYSKGIAVDVRGNIYLVGSVNESIDGQPYSGQSDAFVMKYDGAGVRQWTRLLGSTGDDVAWDATVDGNGGIYAAGHVDGSGDPSGQGKEDAFVSEYDETGALRWTHIFGSSAVDGAEGVAVSANGAIYLSGYTFGNLDGQANLGGGNAFVSRINP
jgi:hypothetical protein